MCRNMDEFSMQDSHTYIGGFNGSDALSLWIGGSHVIQLCPSCHNESIGLSNHVGAIEGPEAAGESGVFIFYFPVTYL